MVICKFYQNRHGSYNGQILDSYGDVESGFSCYPTVDSVLRWADSHGADDVTLDSVKSVKEGGKCKR